MNSVFHEAKNRLLTVRDWLRFTLSQFQSQNLSFGHGFTEAWDEAVYLVLHSLNLPQDRLEPFLDAALLPSEIERLSDLLQQRIQNHVPTAYLTHEAWLGDFSFYVDERVIIPRSFIAELLREQLQPWVSEPTHIRSALDLCTGSGCLAILLAHAFPNADVDAVDISADALAVAQKNVAEYALDDQIQLMKSDLFSNLRDKHYDLIISNPPYVNACSMEELPAEYRHEPELALGSGEDGLDHTRIILREAAKHLNDGGLLIVEIGHNRAELEAAYPQLPFTWLAVASGDEFVFMLSKEELLQGLAMSHD